MTNPTQLPAWIALAANRDQIAKTTLKELFAADPARGERLTAEACGLYLDYSKNRVNDETLKNLVQLAKEVGLEDQRDKMFAGEKINITENRAVLHVALRAPKGQVIKVDGVDVVPEVHKVLEAMGAFADRIRSGEWKGHTGKRIKNVINLSLIHISEPTRPY